MGCKGYISLIFLSLTGIQSTSLIGKQNYYEACWEKCFQDIENVFQPREQQVYSIEASRFLDIGTYARYLKNTDSVNGTAILLDYTFSKWHDQSINPMLQEYERVIYWHFQKGLDKTCAF